jgi:hypothetical protein
VGPWRWAWRVALRRCNCLRWEARAGSQDISCESLNAERARLVAERDDLNKPQLSRTDAERGGELTRVNGKLYAVAKAQFDMKCPAVATGPRGFVVR